MDPTTKLLQDEIEFLQSEIDQCRMYGTRSHFCIKAKERIEEIKKYI